MKKRTTILLAATAALILAACATSPAFVEGAAPTPPDAYEQAAQAMPAPVDPAWWRALDDPALDVLVDRALADNRDITVAEAELGRARALAAVQGWSLLPSGDASASAARTREAAALSGGTALAPDTDLYAVGFGASWEADLFGRLRAQNRAAQMDAAAMEAARRGVATAVAAQTAETYIALRGAEARLEAARATAESQAQTLRLTEDMRSDGRGSGLDVARAQEQLAATQTNIPLLEADRDAALYALDVLTGGARGAAAQIVARSSGVPTPPAAPGLGAPEELLRRRPDIVEARARLDAAAARADAARVDWWPRVTLVGGLGLESLALGDLGADESLSFTIGPRIDWPALDFRRNELRLEAARFGAEAEFARYDRTIAAGLADVEIALSALAATRQASVLADQAAEAAIRAAEVARIRYREGLDTFIQVLDSERRLAEAEDRRARAAAAAAIAYVRLGLALGAGWEAAGGMIAAQDGESAPS